MRTRTHEMRAFTLMELMVCVAIIAVLAAILFPVFGAAKERAKVSVCSSNLRQLGAAIILYTQDNSGYLPPYLQMDKLLAKVAECNPEQTIPEPEEETRMLVASMMPYVRSKDLFFCPLDRVARQDLFYMDFNHLLTSYEFAGFPTRDARSNTFCDLAQWPPHRSLAFAEARGDGLCGDMLGSRDARNDVWFFSDAHASNHGDSSKKAQVVHADLHIESFPISIKMDAPPEG